MHVNAFGGAQSAVELRSTWARPFDSARGRLRPAPTWFLPVCTAAALVILIPSCPSMKKLRLPASAGQQKEVALS